MTLIEPLLLEIYKITREESDDKLTLMSILGKLKENPLIDYSEVYQTT